MDLDTQWSSASFEIKSGRDPLGLQTITTDRIMPLLTPGILALSRRARYLSFHLFLLDEYERRRQPATRSALSDFIRRFEYDLALAIQFCPRGCWERSGIGTVGQDAVRGVRDLPGPFPPDFSVKSPLGGYGLYYRSPLIAMGLVHREGTGLGEQAIPTPIDVIDRELGREIAHEFRTRVEASEYYETYMFSPAPRPRRVLERYAETACLCRLDDSPTERALLRRAILEDRPSVPDNEAASRRRAFAFWLELVGRDARVTDEIEAFRRAVWDWFTTEAVHSDGDARSDSVAAWAALIAREVIQEGWSSIWSGFCRNGVQTQGPYGLDPLALPALIDRALKQSFALPTGVTVSIDPNENLQDCLTRLVSSCEAIDPETLRLWCAEEDSLPAGLLTMLVMRQRLPDPARVPMGWHRIGREDGASQPGLLRLAGLLDALMGVSETVGMLARQLVERLVIEPHERIAYGKLPEFTFRFRWTDGRLRFYTETMTDHFGPSDIRHASLAWLAYDLGLYDEDDDTAWVTPEGKALAAETFG